MKKVINSIESETSLKCFRTVKYSLDDTSKPIIKYDDDDRVSNNPKQRFAEDDKTHIESVDLTLIAERELGNPLFKYFLDGSRRTYKIDDIAVGERIYPIVAGQIAVGCCCRENKYKFSPKISNRYAVLSMPNSINVDDHPEKEFFNDLISSINNTEILKRMNFKFDKIFNYPTNTQINDKKVKNHKSDKEIYEDLAVAYIQNEMMDLEQQTVRELCAKNLLNDSAYLIKDGSLEYSLSFSNMKSIDISKYKENFRHVVGVSKSFNPDLFKNSGKSISRTIACLKEFHRTKAYYYVHENSAFAVWYLRLRKNIHQDNQFSGVVKVEMLLTTDNDLDYGLSTDVVNLISANLINERNPVCFGKDTRWANHLYPVFLTETYLKSQYLSNEFFFNLF